MIRLASFVLSLALMTGFGAATFAKESCCCGAKCECKTCTCKTECKCGNHCDRPVKK